MYEFEKIGILKNRDKLLSLTAKGYTSLTC